MKAIVMSANDKSTEEVAISEQAFGRKFNSALVHQVVTSYQSCGRQGTKGRKNRSEVSGGGKKPWRQKGTGRARAGTTRGPLWTGGGVTFDNTQNHLRKTNRKMYRGAMQSIISELFRQDRVVILKDLKIEEPKTKTLLNTLNELSIKNALIVTTEIDENLYLASRNLKKIDIAEVTDLNPVSLIAFEKLVITLPALRQIEESYK
jgi:large subunit ribosomal protein L4